MDKLREILFWDFQGTLAYNEWMFSKALYKVLIKNGSNTEISIEDLKKKSLQGFPCKIKDGNLKLSDEHDKYEWLEFNKINVEVIDENEDSNIELNIPLK